MKPKPLKIQESEADPEIAEVVEGVVEEITAAVMKEYPITPEELHNLVYFAPAKGVLPDSIYRVGYDPIRKLSKGDRLTGAAELCLKRIFLPFLHRQCTGLKAGQNNPGLYTFRRPRDS